jgi:hypothetical protein
LLILVWKISKHFGSHHCQSLLAIVIVKIQYILQGNYYFCFTLLNICTSYNLLIDLNCLNSLTLTLFLTLYSSCCITSSRIGNRWVYSGPPPMISPNEWTDSTNVMITWESSSFATSLLFKVYILSSEGSILFLLEKNLRPLQWLSTVKLLLFFSQHLRLLTS